MNAPPGRVLGIDYGTKRLGLAVSDPLRVVAGGVAAIPHDEHLMERLAEIVHELNPVLIIVGMPYAPDGGKGAMAKEVESFIDALKAALDIPVQTWDESHTSVTAEQVFRTIGMRRRRRRERGRVDTMAARILLQEFLERCPQPQGSTSKGTP